MGDFAFGSNTFLTRSYRNDRITCLNFSFVLQNEKMGSFKSSYSITVDWHIKAKAPLLLTPLKTAQTTPPRADCPCNALNHWALMEEQGLQKQLFPPMDTQQLEPDLPHQQTRLRWKLPFQSWKGWEGVCPWTYNFMYLPLLRASSKMRIFYCSDKMYKCFYVG